MPVISPAETLRLATETSVSISRYTEFRIDLVLACSGEHGARGEDIRRVDSEIAAELEPGARRPRRTSRCSVPLERRRQHPRSTFTEPVLLKVVRVESSPFRSRR